MTSLSSVTYDLKGVVQAAQPHAPAVTPHEELLKHEVAEKAGTDHPHVGCMCGRRHSAGLSAVSERS